MASWQPEPQSLGELYQLIIDSKSVDSATRNAAAQVLPLHSLILHHHPLVLELTISVAS